MCATVCRLHYKAFRHFFYLASSLNLFDSGFSFAFSFFCIFIFIFFARLFICFHIESFLNTLPYLSLRQFLIFLLRIPLLCHFSLQSVALNRGANAFIQIYTIFFCTEKYVDVQSWEHKMLFYSFISLLTNSRHSTLSLSVTLTHSRSLLSRFIIFFWNALFSLKIWRESSTSHKFIKCLVRKFITFCRTQNDDEKPSAESKRTAVQKSGLKPKESSEKNTQNWFVLWWVFSLHHSAKICLSWRSLHQEWQCE